MRGGVERMRWRARDSRGTMVLGSGETAASAVPHIGGGAQEGARGTDLCWQPWCGEGGQRDEGRGRAAQAETGA